LEGLVLRNSRPLVAAARSRTETIRRLYGELKKARAAVNAIPEPDRAAFERADAKVSRMAARIAQAPADTFDEAALKIEAVMQEGDFNDALECLASLRQDLRRMEARTLRRGAAGRRAR
jgi:hypothetical protein